jgi:uncharacterized protein with HEPN domain
MLNKDKLSLSGMLEAIDKIEVYTSSINTGEELFNKEIHFDAVLMNFKNHLPKLKQDIKPLL